LVQLEIAANYERQTIKKSIIHENPVNPSKSIIFPLAMKRVACVLVFFRHTVTGACLGRKQFGLGRAQLGRVRGVNAGLKSAD